MRSEIDWFYRLLIWTTIALIVVVIAMSLTAGAGSRGVVLILGLPVLAFLLSMYFGTFYEFHDDHLYCRSGPLWERIPYDRIRSVRLCQNAFSSMALSMRRIEIRRHGRGWVTGTTFISPVSREVFFLELIGRCRNLDGLPG